MSVSSIVAFTTETHTAFDTWLASQNIRSRISHEKYRALLQFLQHPSTPTTTQDDHRLKWSAMNEYALDTEGQLCKRITGKQNTTNTGNSCLRRVVLEHEIFAIIKTTHLTLLHAGKIKHSMRLMKNTMVLEETRYVKYYYSFF